MSLPPFNPDETKPQDQDIVSQFPLLNRENIEDFESWLTVLSDPASGHLKLPTDTTANLAALSPAQPIGGLRFDLTLDVLQFKKGSSTWDAISFPSGTRMVFQQSDPPPGWTKISDAAYEDAILQSTTGSVGTAGTIGASAFLIDDDNIKDGEVLATGLTTDAGGDHGHPWRHNPSASGTDADGGLVTSNDGSPVTRAAFTGTPSDTTGEQIGGSGTHTHTFDVVTNLSAETPMFTQIKTVSFIVAEKD